MKRTVQMKNAGVANPEKPSKFKGFRKPWREGEVVNHQKPLKAATAAFLVEGSEGAIRILGSRSKFAALSPEIQARAKLWMRAARGLD